MTNPGGNGTQDNKPLNTGVFIYLIEAELLDGTVQQFQGDLFLSR